MGDKLENGDHFIDKLLISLSICKGLLRRRESFSPKIFDAEEGVRK
jgi:hypothetical protein